MFILQKDNYTGYSFENNKVQYLEGGLQILDTDDLTSEVYSAEDVVGISRKIKIQNLRKQGSMLVFKPALLEKVNDNLGIDYTGTSVVYNGNWLLAFRESNKGACVSAFSPKAMGTTLCSSDCERKKSLKARIVYVKREGVSMWIHVLIKGVVFKAYVQNGDVMGVQLA